MIAGALVRLFRLIVGPDSKLDEENRAIGESGQIRSKAMVTSRGGLSPDLFRSLSNVLISRKRVPSDSFLLASVLESSLLLLSLGTAPFASGATTSAGHVVNLNVVDSKEIRFARLSTEDGLSQNVVLQIQQDDQGFMWFGTADGLNRFDGYEFKVYKRGQPSVPRLAGSWISALFKDRSGVLWVGADDFLERFDPKADTITHYRSDAKDANSPSGTVRGITQDESGALWLATSRGLDRLDATTGKFTHYRLNESDPNSLNPADSDEITSISQDHDTVWAQTHAGMNAFNTRTDKATRYPQLLNPTDSTQPLRWEQHVYEDRTGRHWVFSPLKGLSTFDPHTGELIQYRFHSRDPKDPAVNDIFCMVQDEDGVFWLGTGGSGVLKFDPRDGSVLRFRHDPFDSKSLGDDWVTSLFEDREQNIWVATSGGGIAHFPRRTAGFQAYKKNQSTNSLDQDFVLSVFEDSERQLWIGTDLVLNCLDLKTGRFTRYQSSPTEPGSIGSGSVLSALEDSSGTLWLGTYGGGLNRFDRKTRRFTSYRYRKDNPNGISSDVIRRIIQDHQGIFWIATDSGFDRFDPRTQRFTHIGGVFDKLANSQFSDMVEDHHGYIWIGTVKAGLIRFHPGTGDYRVFTSDPNTPTALSSNHVNNLLIGTDGTLWVGTQQGLNKFHYDTDTFTSYGERDGLPNDYIHGALDDGRNLWLGTNRGLVKFDPTSGKSIVYYTVDGLAGDQFNSWGSPFKSRDGEMFFPGIDGLTPSSLPD